MTAGDDIETVASQLADLTRTVEQMGNQLKEMRDTAASQKERSDVQQERIDHAARELTEVSDRLQLRRARSEHQSDRGPQSARPAMVDVTTTL